MGLDVELHQGSLIGATPMGSLAANNTLEPIILSFDTHETRNKVLKAAAKKEIKGAGSFPKSGREKYYFTEPKTCQRSSSKQ